MAAVGSSIEEPKTLVDAQPLLQPLTRNWATGARLEFLSNYIEDYKAALIHPNREAASDLIDKIVNGWFEKFHWTLTVKEDPAVVKPRVPLSEGGFEHLSAEDSATKGKVIGRMRTSLTNWFDCRTKRAAKKRPKSAADPATVLLDRLLGTDSGPPKLARGWAVWGKANFASMKAAFDEAFEAGGRPENQRASECNKYKKLEFERLSEEEQELWNDKAKEDHRSAKEAYKNRKEGLLELLPPKEAQLALNELPNVLGPVIQGLGQALGMHITLLLGGPEPKKKGILNIISLHQGLNKAPVPKPWGVADKEGFKIVKAQFLEFLKTCYSPEEQRARALDESDSTKPLANSIASTSNIDRGADLNEEGAQTSPVSVPAATGDMRKRKRAEKGSVKPRKKRAKQKKHRNAADEELDAEDNDEDDDEEGGESSSGEEPTSDEDEELPSTRSKKSTKGTTMDPSRFVGDSETGVESPVNRNIDTGHLPSIQLLEPAAVDGDIAHAPIVQLPGSTSIPGAASLTTAPLPLTIESASIAGAAPLAADRPPLAIEGLQLPTVITLPPVDVKWLAWFGKAYTQLSSENLGPAFSATVLKYVELEGRNNFAIGVAGSGFKNDKRPDEVAWWIARGCKVTPTITLQKLTAFEEAWWAWWKGLQPIARGATEVEGFLNATHRGHLDGEDQWACVRKYGQNGWYTVLATLVWWATTLGDGCPSHAGWVAAVEDVSWVLSQALGPADSSSSSLISQKPAASTTKKRPRSSLVPQVPVVSTSKKRTRSSLASQVPPLSPSKKRKL